MAAVDPAQVEAWRVAGLYDPEAPGAPDRLGALTFMAGLGVTTERMLAALAEDADDADAIDDAFAWLVTDVALRPGERLTVAEAARRADMPEARVIAVLRALGVPPWDPDEAFLTPDDCPGLAFFEVGASIMGLGPLIRFTQVLGASYDRIAEAAIAMHLERLAGPMVMGGADESTIVRATYDSTRALAALHPELEGLFRLLVDLAIRRNRLSRQGLSDDAFGSVRMAIGFVDLVGFTSFAHGADPEELSALIDDFETRAHEIVTERGGRIVKVIGDEVMFATVEPEAACDAALALLEAFRGADVTPRGGVAFGPMLARSGDYFGPVVNLGARIADLAVPDEVLVTVELAEGVSSPGLRFVPAGRRMLKGFPDAVDLRSVERA